MDWRVEQGLDYPSRATSQPNRLQGVGKEVESHSFLFTIIINKQRKNSHILSHVQIRLDSGLIRSLSGVHKTHLSQHLTWWILDTAFSKIGRKTCQAVAGTAPVPVRQLENDDKLTLSYLTILSTFSSHAFPTLTSWKGLSSRRRPWLLPPGYNFNWITPHNGFICIDCRAWSQ